MSSKTTTCIEIRSYQLKPGQRAAFHRHFMQDAWPLLLQWDVDVVAFGSSPHDEDSYYLIRAYDSLAHRQASQDAFYGSADWRLGPRESIVSRIETYTSIVLDMDPIAIDALRQGHPAAQTREEKAA
ncbi:NIPSNAP family protein [Undibacterium terreum]|uniref:NIPSNAP family protein n=1 Tax=Undibacterium terreum TaxID=1224302 RepID=A0A916U6P3_9BURK|nr:NIPSNAP family protein [Undibacterium terreum]GGC62722.1 NIPSNAP family protein [Undibacterium terreum]